MKTKLSVLGLALVLGTLIASSCTPTTAEPTAVPTIAPTEPPTEVPTATPTEAAVEVPDPARARDAALATVSQSYSEQAPAPNLAWAEETVTPEGLVGSSTFQYTADDWVVTVSFPVVAPQATIYTVVVANQATGFQWEGEIDATGQVTEQAIAEGADVACEGVSFSYDDALAAGVVAETVPTVGPAGPAIAEWEVEPEHVRFSFDGYILPETFHEPRIVVYPVSDFEATSEIAGKIIAAVRRSLAEKPATPEATPIVPPFNAGQLMHTQLAYVDFQNGTGMRFLTQLGQAYAPINNHEVFYAFQGITHDGQYYVAAILPASHPTLPADGAEIPGGDYGAFAENFESYASDVEQQLDAQDASSFTPDLSLLDAMIQSLKITTEQSKVSAPAPTEVVYDYEGWETYTSEKFGYTLRYPADCTVMGADHDASVQFVGPVVGDEHWPWFFVDHYDSDFYRPPAGTDVNQWIADSGMPYDEIGPEVKVAGLPTMHTVYKGGPGAYDSDDYYFIRGDQLFRISILHAGGKQDWELYDQFLRSFTFP